MRRNGSLLITQRSANRLAQGCAKEVFFVDIDFQGIFSASRTLFHLFNENNMSLVLLRCKISWYFLKESNFSYLAYIGLFECPLSAPLFLEGLFADGKWASSISYIRNGHECESCQWMARWVGCQRGSLNESCQARMGHTESMCSERCLKVMSCIEKACAELTWLLNLTNESLSALHINHAVITYLARFFRPNKTLKIGRLIIDRIVYRNIGDALGAEKKASGEIRGGVRECAKECARGKISKGVRECVRGKISKGVRECVRGKIGEDVTDCAKKSVRTEISEKGGTSCEGACTFSDAISDKKLVQIQKIELSFLIESISQVGSAEPCALRDIFFWIRNNCGFAKEISVDITSGKELDKKSRQALLEDLSRNKKKYYAMLPPNVPFKARYDECMVFYSSGRVWGM